MPLHATTDLMFHAALNAGCSQGLAGLYMLLGPGLGVVPLDEETTEKFAGILKVWQQVADDSGLPLTLTQSNLFAFIGACKVSAPLGLWGLLGSKVELLANICLLPQLAGAVYTHHMTDQDYAPATVMLTIATVRLIMLLKEPSAIDDKKKSS